MAIRPHHEQIDGLALDGFQNHLLWITIPDRRGKDMAGGRKMTDRVREMVECFPGSIANQEELAFLAFEETRLNQKHDRRTGASCSVVGEQKRSDGAERIRHNEDRLMTGANDTFQIPAQVMFRRILSLARSADHQEVVIRFMIL